MSADNGASPSSVPVPLSVQNWDSLDYYLKDKLKISDVRVFL